MGEPDDKVTERGEEVSGEGGDEQAPALSKNQMKKQLRMQRWAETKKERRKKEKEKIRERKRREIEERRKQGLDDTLPGVKRRKMSDPEASDIRVAIDCAYDSFMAEPDVRKLVKQIQRCYSENRKSARPLQLYVSSLRDRSKQVMDALVQGYHNWDVHFRAESPDAAFGAENIVYLAAESPNVLQELQPDKVYIIGGLVDHNHHKGICFRKVTEMGWSHAQLPIGDFVKLNSRKVLAVNHVYEIILAYIQLGNWRDAFFQVLPSRKVSQFYPTEDNPVHDGPARGASADPLRAIGDEHSDCEDEGHAPVGAEEGTDKANTRLQEEHEPCASDRVEVSALTGSAETSQECTRDIHSFKEEAKDEETPNTRVTAHSERREGKETNRDQDLVDGKR